MWRCRCCLRIADAFQRRAAGGQGCHGAQRARRAEVTPYAWIEASPLAFFRACRDVYLYAFSTASSNATLPLAIETAEQKLRLSPRISRFVLTVGSTANQNGTALFEGITVLFLAQVYGKDLSLGEQGLVMVICVLAGIGTLTIVLYENLR